MKHADYRSFASDDLHMDYSSPEDEEALLPEVKTTVPRSRSLKRTLITGVVVVITIVCLGLLVSSSGGSAAKVSSTNGASMFQSVSVGNYINHDKFIARAGIKRDRNILHCNSKQQGRGSGFGRYEGNKHAVIPNEGEKSLQKTEKDLSLCSR